MSEQFDQSTSNAPVQAISAKDAAALDKDLMDIGGWSLDQLMELAGLSVSQAGQYPAEGQRPAH